MNGHLLPLTPIAVDFWKVVKGSTARVFFLTHMHQDHIQGLTPSWNQLIHCSPISKKLLIHQFQFDPSLIKELEVNESYLIPLDEDGSQSMTVTALDANHCPGAVMFIFTGYFGTIFYTGDFRYHPSMLDKVDPTLYKDTDVLYLDNTYCSPKCIFPSREEAEVAVLDILEANLSKQVIIGVRNLGKEELLERIAIKLHKWIQVSDKKYKILQVLDRANVFTTDADCEGIKTEPLRRITSRFMKEHPDTIAILPTALYSEETQAYASCPNVYIVPYSDHSSYDELHQFVEKVHPKKVCPLIQSSARGVFGSSLTHRADMSCFNSYLNPDPSKRFSVPSEVSVMMNKSIVLVKSRQHRPMKRSIRKPAHKGVLYLSPDPSPEKMTAKPKDSSPSKLEEEVNSFLNTSVVVEAEVHQSSENDPHSLKLQTDRVCSEMLTSNIEGDDHTDRTFTPLLCTSISSQAQCDHDSNHPRSLINPLINKKVAEPRNNICATAKNSCRIKFKSCKSHVGRDCPLISKQFRYRYISLIPKNREVDYR